MPEQGSGHTNDDSEPGKVPTKGGLHGDGEGDVETSFKNTIQDEWDGTAKTSENDADDGFTPGQSNGEDGRWSHPRLSVQGV